MGRLSGDVLIDAQDVSTEAHLPPVVARAMGRVASQAAVHLADPYAELSPKTTRFESAS
jgi:hypothetical protein